VPLNQAQVAVLRWIAAGSPAGVMKGNAHRISAAALRTRDLVRIFGRGNTWRAQLTDRGREELERLEHAESSQPTQRSSENDHRLRDRPRKVGSSAAAGRAKSLSKTEQLVDDVVAAGGRLCLPDETGRGGVNWRQRAYAAQRHGKVPAGKHLRVSRTDNGFEIELRDGETGNALGAEAVPVPARLSRYHPVAREYRNRTNLHEVSRKALPRALRIVHALATEAERRGYKLACVSVHEDAYGRSEWRPAQDGQFIFTINGHHLTVRLWEKGAGLRGPYERERKRWQEDREKPFREMLFLDRPKPYDRAATGELNIEVTGWSHGRQSRWGDRKRWTLEDRLPQLMRELETQAAEAEERRLAKEREEAERQRQWELAMERAKLALIEAHRRKVLRDRVAAWNEGDAIRAYCDAVEQRHGGEAVAGPETAEWIAFARESADRAQELPRMPADLEITPEALKPYLGRWSPYGPHGW
jgi:hypothetical protein